MKDIENRLEYAERILKEKMKEGLHSDIDYWIGYRDAVKQMMNETKEMDETVVEQLFANQTAIMSAIATILKGGYGSNVALKILDIGIKNTCELMGYETDENENS